MGRLIGRLIKKKMFWLDSNRLFGMLIDIYIFQDFLVEIRSLSPEEAKQNKKACASLFEKAYPHLRKQDFKALARQQFPREIWWETKGDRRCSR